MFTGIISATSTVKKVQAAKSGMILAIVKPRGWKVKIGDSITVNGVCSTVKKISPWLVFEYMPESLQRTNLSNSKIGDTVNLEQSLRVSDRLDGHIVQGHVDTPGVLEKITPEGNSYVLTVALVKKSPYRKFLAPKGSVALEGISLTVVDVGSNYFTVKIIPYTWEQTNLHTRNVGDRLNLEFDILAKYLDQLISARY